MFSVYTIFVNVELVCGNAVYGLHVDMFMYIRLWI